MEKVHPHRRLVPRRVPHSLSAVRPVDRTGSLGFSSPQRHPLREPRTRWVIHAPLSSALRFSQPLSGFPASSGFAALFRAAAVRGIRPSESSPRRDRAPLSRPPCSLAVSRPRAGTMSCGPCHRRFPRRLRSRALARFPQTAMDSLSGHPKAHLPFVLDPRDGARSVPLTSPASKPSSPCESVHTCPGCPESVADPLLGFCPSRAFSVHASEPRTRPSHAGSNMSLHPKARGHDGEDLSAPLVG